MVPAPEPTEAMDRAQPAIDRLLRTSPASWGPAKVVQFGWHEDGRVIVYATNMAGDVSQQVSRLQRDKLEVRRSTLSKLTAMTSITINQVRGLDELASSIGALSSPDELLILIPGSVCRGIPLHILKTGSHTLSERNPITYAPSPDLLRQCIERSLDVQRVGTRQRRTTSASVFVCNDPYWTTEIEGVGASVANRLRGTPLISNQVTKRAVSNALNRDQWFFFFGHGWGGRGSDGTLSLPAMILQGGEALWQSDLRELTLPDTTAVLIGCEFSKVRMRQGFELESLALTALQRGAVSAIGTMFEIYVEVPKAIEDALVDGIRPPDGQTNDGALINIAQILQQAAAAMRDENLEPEFWGPLAQYGSPVVRLGHGWVPNSVQVKKG